MTNDLNFSSSPPFAIGKYLVSPLSRRLREGCFSASVSIRSGCGSASTDRVMRFSGVFDSESAAHRHAREQGLMWVSLAAPVRTA